MKTLRQIAMWITQNIPCGILAPYLFGFAINSIPTLTEKAESKRIKSDGGYD